MTFAVRLNSDDPTPPYEQLRRQISDAIASGVLPTGSQLPTVRQLARDLGVANGTVMRAYSELESDGLVRTARGAGTTVTPVPELSQTDLRDRLTALARVYVDKARLIGAGDDKIVSSVHLALDYKR